MNNLKITIPSYDQFCSMNNNREYKGLEFKVHMTENLYLLFEMRNENLIFINGQSKIYVAWCTHNGFPIATETYINCKEGYDEAIKFLFQTAEKFENVFRDFLKNTTVAR